MSGVNRELYESTLARMLLDVEQLRVYQSANRIPLKRTLAEMVEYCKQHEANDPFLSPSKENPFREKKSCAFACM